MARRSDDALYGDDINDSWMDEEEETVGDEVPGIGLGLRSLAGILSGGRFQPIVQALRNSGGDVTARLVALQELSEVLSMSTEDALAAFPTREVVAELVFTLGGPEPARGPRDEDDELAAVLAATAAEDSGELQLLACHCFSNLLEALPQSVHAMARGGAIPVLISKLREITFIDLAEQVLQVLERIAPTYPNAIVREDGLVALLQYVDFFNIHVQRSALSAFAHCCGRLAPAHSRFVAPVAPLLRGVLGSSDVRLVQSACGALCSIIAAFDEHAPLIEELVLDSGLIAAAAALLSGGPSLKSSVYSELYRALAQAARSSTTVAVALFDLGILGTVHTLLAGDASMSRDMRVLSALSRLPEPRVYEAIATASELLPPLPTTGAFDPDAFTAKTLIVQRRRTQKAAANGDDPPQRPQIQNSRSTHARLSELSKVPEFWQQYTALLLPLLVDVYEASVSRSICELALTSLLKVLVYSETETLGNVLNGVPLASFLAGILASYEHEQDVRSALQAVEILLGKFPHLYRPLFEREGITFEVERLASDPDEDEGDSIGVRASFVADYLHTPLAADDSVAPALESAHAIRARIEGVAAALRKAVHTEADIDDTLAEFRTLLTKERATSVELLRAGVVEALIEFASKCDGVPRERRRAALRSALRGDATVTLVQRLQESVNRLERFEVASTPADDGTPAVARHMRLQLKADKSMARELPASCRSMIVEVHAVARLQALSDYLRPKLALLTSRGSLSGMLAALAATGDDDEDRGVLEELEKDDDGDEDPNGEASNEQNDNDEAAEEVAEEGGDDASDDAGDDVEVDADDADEAFAVADIEAENSDAQEEGPDDAPENSGARSYSSVRRAPTHDWHLEFRLGDQVLPLESTVFGAVYTSVCGSGQPTAPLWSNVYSLTFSKADGPPKRSMEERDTSKAPLIPPNAPLAQVVDLLGVLLELGGDAEPFVSKTQLVNNRLTAKLGSQLDEPLIVTSECLPRWATELPHKLWYLFSFEARLQLFRSVSFGYARVMGRLRLQDPSDETLRALSRVPRQKVRIARDNILPSAVKVMELYGADKSLLEVEYFDEVGSGLGPTLEFYALASREFARADLGMWRASATSTDSSGTVYVHTPQGFFPAALPKEKHERKHILLLFHALGTFVAKSMLDSRIIDVPLSLNFIRDVLGDPAPLTLESLNQIDPELARSLSSIAQLPEQEVEALALDFTLPGASHIELIDNGSEHGVTAANRDEYIALILEHSLCAVPKEQVLAFRRGFSHVLSIDALSLLRPDELASIFGSCDEDWTEETLRRAIVPDHGFSASSREVGDLVAILSAFSVEDRRTFLQWLTGSPRLPVGGFTALQPPLTVVRRQHEEPLKPDDYLPSVMTCVNYLKLPCYSSRDMMRTRLETAMREGLTTFHLS